MKSLQRFFFISTTLFPPFFRYALVRNKPDSPAYKESISSIRLALQKLGPTYVKFGQMLSARPDLIGFNLATELRTLLDKEPIVPFEEIQKEIERELQLPWKKVFKTVDPTPLATASIAQVHKATLHSGKTVAIKVQRPGIEKIIKSDLPVLKNVSMVLDLILHAKGLKFAYIFRQFSEWILNELDFQIEGKRADKFQENMASVDDVKIPKIYWEYTTSKVMTLEYFEGHTINTLLNMMQEQKVTTLYDVKLDFKIDADILIQRIIAAIAKQALVDKFFHGDLHPANIIIQKNNVVAFVDFGIVGSLNEEEHTQILLCMLALVESDPQSLVKVITSLISDPLSPKDLSDIHQEFSDELHKLHEDIGGKITLNHVLTLLFPLSEKYHVMWSSGFLLAAKSIGQIDAVAQLIGLRASLVDLMKPEVEKAVTLSFSNNFSKETLYSGVMDLIQAGKKLPQTINGIEQLISTNQLFPSALNQTRSRNSFSSHAILAGSSFVISLPFVTSSFIIHSSYRILFTVGIPLLLFILLGNIFKNERG